MEMLSYNITPLLLNKKNLPPGPVPCVDCKDFARVLKKPAKKGRPALLSIDIKPLFGYIDLS